MGGPRVFYRQVNCHHNFSYKDAESCLESVVLTFGGRCLARSYRRRGTEIDLIWQKKSLVVFLEVKLRKKAPDRDCDWQEIFPLKKKKALQRGAVQFLHENGDVSAGCEAYRFDLAVVSYPFYCQISRCYKVFGFYWEDVIS